MTVWTDDAKVDLLAEQARAVRPGRVLHTVIAAVGTAIGWVKTAWPQIIRAGRWATEAIAGIFVAAGWVLGFGVFCVKAMIYGFCTGAGIPQPAELIARRRQARQEKAPPAVPGGKP